MAEYIKREDAYTTLTDYYHHSTETQHMALKEALNRVPTADVRPVVLCKDCMYAPSGTDGGGDQGFALEWPHDEWPEENPCPCKCDDGWYSHKPNPEFYCANGKREES